MTKADNLISNFKLILKQGNLRSLHKPLYEFIHLHCGFIAHYDLNGFIGTYEDGRRFQGFLESLKEGCEIHACDLEDNYNHGYTNKEVKERIRELITNEYLHKLALNLSAMEKKDRYGEFLKLRAEFEGKGAVSKED